jgi:hypothetical protein
MWWSARQLTGEGSSRGGPSPVPRYDRAMTARRLLVSVGVASALGGGVAAAGLAAGADASCVGSPRLELAGSDPLKLAGSGFCARERLRVRVRAGESRRVRRVRADESGSFRVRFGQVHYDPCSSTLRASARSAGDLRASLKRPQTLCPVPMQPPGGTPPAEPSGPSGPAPDRCSGPGITHASGKSGAQPLCPPA